MPIQYDVCKAAKSAELMDKPMTCMLLCMQVLTQAEFVAARQEGALQKRADGSWGPPGELLSGERPPKRARQDVSTAAGAAQQKGQHGRRCAVM